MVRRAFLAFVALLVAGLLAACGGDDKSSSAPSSDSSEKPGTVLEQVDLAQSVQNLQKLQSFRFDLAMKIDMGGSGAGASNTLDDAFGSALLGAFGDIKASGSVVMPDQAELSMTMLGQEFSFVQIGSQAWVKTGSVWQATTADSLSFGSPDDLFSDLLPSEVLRGAKTSREKVNGVDAVRYSFDKKALQALADYFGESADMTSLQDANLDIWLNSDSIPVKMTMKFSGRDDDGQLVSFKLELNLKDINSPSIKVKAPV